MDGTECAIEKATWCLIKKAIKSYKTIKSLIFILVSMQVYSTILIFVFFVYIIKENQDNRSQKHQRQCEKVNGKITCTSMKLSCCFQLLKNEKQVTY